MIWGHRFNLLCVGTTCDPPLPTCDPSGAPWVLPVGASAPSTAGTSSAHPDTSLVGGPVSSRSASPQVCSWTPWRWQHGPHTKIRWGTEAEQDLWGPTCSFLREWNKTQRVKSDLSKETQLDQNKDGLALLSPASSPPFPALFHRYKRVSYLSNNRLLILSPFSKRH